MIAEWANVLRPEVVAGPTTGGVIISYETARLLGLRGIFAEKVEGGRAFERGFTIGPGERVLVVDDVLTTGGSVRDVLEAVHRAGGEPVGVAVLVDRTAGTIDFGVPCFACLTLEVPAYEAEACPLCKDEIPLKVT
jgi:orotate phosphoribosyltransferase